MRDNSNSPFTGWRMTFFQGVIFAIFTLFAVRSYQLMIIENEGWQSAANENRLNELPVAAPRGTIRDRNGLPLAENVPAFNVRIVPAELPLDEEATVNIYNRLSALTGVPPTAAIARASSASVRSIEELVIEGEGIAPFRPVVIAYDENGNRAVDPAEGVSGISVRVVEVGTNRVIAQAFTDSSGFAQLQVVTSAQSRVVVPYFGKVWQLPNSRRGGNVRFTLLLTPGNQPGLIP